MGRRKYGSAWAQIETVMVQYGEAMTARDISSLLPDMPMGTIGSQLSQRTAEGRLRTEKVNGKRDRIYWLNNGYDPEQIVEAEVVEEPDQVAVDPWEAVRIQWQVVFGVKVSGEDARLMVELAAREVRRGR
jgi:hypothetical protein